MSWLSAHAGALLDLDQEREAASALERLRALLAASPLADGTDNAIRLLEKLAQGEPIAGLEAVPEELRERLLKWFTKMREANPEIDHLARLTSPLSGICAADVKPLEPLVWPLDAAVGGAAADIQLKAGLRGQAAVRLDVCPPLPARAGGPPPGQVVLRLLVQGQLEVKLGVGLPLGHLTASASAASAGELACEFYSLHDGGTRLASAVAAGMSRLGTWPFDLAAIAARFRHQELLCVALAGEGRVSLGGRIALASPLTLAGGAIELASVAYGYKAMLDGGFDLLIRHDPGQPDKVVLYLTRQRGSGHKEEAVVGVGVDVGSAYRRIRAEMLPLLEETGVLLEKAEVWLEPGQLIREVVQMKLGELDSPSEKLLAPALEAVLGFKPGSSVLDALAEILADEVTLKCLDLEGDAQTASIAVLDSVLGRLNASGSQRQELLGKLSGKLASALQDIQGKVESKLKDLAAHERIQVITNALDKIGEKIQAGLGEPEAKLAGLRRLVVAYRKRATELYAVLEGVTELKVGASLRHIVGHEEERGADLVLRFDPAHATARQAFCLALLGTFDEVLRLAQAPGQGVEVLDCSLSRVLQDTEANTLELALLGFTVAGGAILRRETRIDTDAAGNISVVSAADFRRRREWLGESKTIRLADVFELVAARYSRSLKLEATLSYEDRKLDVAEAEGFFASLVAAELLGRGAAERAGALLRDTEFNTPSCNQEGRLDVSLALHGEAVERLLGGEEEAATHADRVRRVAAEETARAYLARCGIKERDLLGMLDDQYAVRPTLVATILAFDDHTLNSGTGTHIDSLWNHALAINRMHNIGVALAEALAAMRRLYKTSDEELRQWTAEDYQRKQEEIMLYARSNMPGEFPALFGEKVRPRTVALFRILARLAGRLPATGDVLTATMTVCRGKAKRVRRLA